MLVGVVVDTHLLTAGIVLQMQESVPMASN